MAKAKKAKAEPKKTKKSANDAPVAPSYVALEQLDIVLLNGCIDGVDERLRDIGRAFINGAPLGKLYHVYAQPIVKAQEKLDNAKSLLAERYGLQKYGEIVWEYNREKGAFIHVDEQEKARAKK